MKGKPATLATMLLLLVVAVTAGAVGTDVGATYAQDAVYEADNRWRQQADGGPVSFKVSPKGTANIYWDDWISSYRDLGEGETEYVQPRDWVVTVATPGAKVRTKKTGAAAQRFIVFRGLKIGKDYEVAVKGIDSQGRQLGVQQSATIRLRHVSPPQSVTGLSLTVGDDNLSVSASWAAPAAGGTPKRYAVYLTNLDSGRTRWQMVKPQKKDGGGWNPPETEASFDGLWPGDTYRVSVQSRNRNSRSKRSQDYAEGWQTSAWVSETITMPAGEKPSYEKKVPTLIWFLYRAGEPTPPHVIGKPTMYVISSPETPGGFVYFDAPNKCREWWDHWSFFRSYSNDQPADERAASDARQAARNQQSIIDREIAYRDADVASKAKYLKDTPEAERDAATIARFDQKIARHQSNIDVGEDILAQKEREVVSKCAAAYPVVENLTEADHRFYQIASRQEAE